MNNDYWRELNLLARSYLDLQQTRVALELRCQRLEESELVKEGLYKIVETRMMKESGKEFVGRKIVPVEEGDTDDDKEELEKSVQKKSLRECKPTMHIVFFTPIRRLCINRKSSSSRILNHYLNPQHYGIGV